MTKEEKSKVLLALAYTKSVEHLMPQASKDALAVVERYLDGNATKAEAKQAIKVAARVAENAEVVVIAAWVAYMATKTAIATRNIAIDAYVVAISSRVSKAIKAEERSRKSIRKEI